MVKWVGVRKCLIIIGDFESYNNSAKQNGMPWGELNRVHRNCSRTALRVSLRQVLSQLPSSLYPHQEQARWTRILFLTQPLGAIKKPILPLKKRGRPCLKKIVCPSETHEN